MAATATFQGNFFDATDVTTYTFSSCDFGAASADRYIAVVAVNRGAASRTFVSATIGGIAASVVVANVTNGTNNGVMLIAKVPTGTTGQTISVTWSGGCVRCGIGIWRLNGIAGLVAADTTSSVASPPSTATLDVPVDGCLIVGGFTNANATCTATGYTENYDQVITDSNDGAHSGGSANVPAGATNRTITTTWTTNATPFMVAASFAPEKIITAGTGSYAFTGTAATLTLVRKIAAAAGSYAFTGTAATLKRTRIFAAGAGSYAFTGTAATLKLGRKVSAGVGSYAFTGTAASLKLGRKVAAGVGSYAFTGTAATLKLGKLISAGAGSYAFTGQAATLKRTRLFAAGSGSYAFTGTAAALKFGRLISAGAGAYNFTGTSATLKLGRLITAGAGSYAFTGQAATLTYGAAGSKTLSAGPGSYLFSGTAATLTYVPIVITGTNKGDDVAGGPGDITRRHHGAHHHHHHHRGVRPIVTIRPKAERDLDDLLEIVETVSESKRGEKRTIKAAVAAIKEIEPPPDFAGPIAEIQNSLLRLSLSAAKQAELREALIRIAAEIEAVIARMEAERKAQEQLALIKMALHKRQEKRDEEAIAWLLS